MKAQAAAAAPGAASMSLFDDRPSTSRSSARGSSTLGTSLLVGQPMMQQGLLQSCTRAGTQLAASSASPSSSTRWRARWRRSGGSASASSRTTCRGRTRSCASRRRRRLSRGRRCATDSPPRAATRPFVCIANARRTPFTRASPSLPTTPTAPSRRRPLAPSPLVVPNCRRNICRWHVAALEARRFEEDCGRRSAVALCAKSERTEKSVGSDFVGRRQRSGQKPRKITRSTPTCTRSPPTCAPAT